MNILEQRIHDCVRSQVGDKVVNRIINKVIRQLPLGKAHLFGHNPVFDRTGGRVMRLVCSQTGDQILAQILSQTGIRRRNGL